MVSLDVNNARSPVFWHLPYKNLNIMPYKNLNIMEKREEPILDDAGPRIFIIIVKQGIVWQEKYYVSSVS